MNDEEVAGEVELFDDGELMIDLRPCAPHELGMTRAVARFGTAFGEQSQIRHLVETIGTVVRRQIRSHKGEIERTFAAEFGSTLDHTRIAGETTGLFGTRTQMCTGGCR